MEEMDSENTTPQDVKEYACFLYGIYRVIWTCYDVVLY